MSELIKIPNLIGISGRMGSGKDEVGKIIKYLTSDYYKEGKTYQDFIDNNDVDSNSKYQIKKFADKLKDMVCLLIGCTRADLESHDFKDKELGKEWWYYKHYQHIYGYNKELCSYLGNKDGNGFHKLVKLTPRLILQLLGTECGRQIIHPTIWVNSLFVDYTEDSEQSWIITDCRFENEVSNIKKRGGIIIRVERTIPKTKDEHISETGLDHYEFDHVIENDSDIPSLIEKIKELNIV
jgi:hypothetical protein